jgi:type IV secretion system protein VirB10
MRKGGLKMSDDKIENIGSMSKKDRAELNIGNKQGNKKSKNMVVGFLILLALLVIAGAGAFSFFIAGSQKKAETLPEENTNYEAGQNKSILEDSNNFFNSVERRLEQKKALEEARANAAAKSEQEKEPEKIEIVRTYQPEPQPAPQPPPQRSSSNYDRDQPMTPEQRKLTGSVTVKTSGSTSAPSIESNYDDSFNGSRFKDGSASLRADGSLDFLLIHGMNIPCSLYTQIISDYSGFVTCRVIKDVYSANGSILLVEAGSVISGTQKVALEHGKSRSFTTWTDIETRNGVKVIIDSLGTGPLGAAGHEVWVDKHFPERFGGAILLSFVDDALGALARSASNEDIQFDNSTENASDMASKALESSINIAPTGYSYLGQRINILIARDIDMSSVYKIENVQ